MVDVDVVVGVVELDVVVGTSVGVNVVEIIKIPNIKQTNKQTQITHEKILLVYVSVLTCTVYHTGY